MNRIRIAVLVAALVALFVAPTHALHCNGDIITIDTGGETFYLDDRSDRVGHIDHWLYHESNGEPGLQSGWHDKFPPPGCGELINCEDNCLHPNPDYLIL